MKLYQQPPKLLFSLVAALIVATPAVAQVASPNPYNGEWVFDYSNPSQKFHGVLIINENEGSWKSSTHVRMDNCIGRQYPIRVVVADDKKLVFVIESAKVDTSCNDVKVVVQPNDNKALTGTYGKNPSLVLTR
jgi:hypothetical protein